jgi:hypothetical protein
MFKLSSEKINKMLSVLADEKNRVEPLEQHEFLFLQHLSVKLETGEEIVENERVRLIRIYERKVKASVEISELQRIFLEEKGVIS